MADFQLENLENQTSKTTEVPIAKGTQINGIDYIYPQAPTADIERILDRSIKGLSPEEGTDPNAMQYV